MDRHEDSGHRTVQRSLVLRAPACGGRDAVSGVTRGELLRDWKAERKAFGWLLVAYALLMGVVPLVVSGPVDRQPSWMSARGGKLPW